VGLVGGGGGGVKTRLHAFLNAVLGGDHKSASRSRCHICRKIAPCSHSVAGGMGLRGKMDALKKRKSLVPTGYQNRIS